MIPLKTLSTKLIEISLEMSKVVRGDFVSVRVAEGRVLFTVEEKEI